MAVTSHLVFDPSSLTASANVGAYVRAGSDGDLIASQTIASSEWLQVAAATFDKDGNGIGSHSNALDVYLTNAMAVNLDGVYDSGSNSDPDNIGIIAHVRNASPADAHQTFRSTGGAANADDVVAANVFGLDVNAFGMVFDGTTWDRLRGTSGAVHIHDGGSSITVDGTVDIGNTVTVQATDLDIRNLDAAQDDVGAWLHDGTGNAITSTSGYLDVNIASSSGTMTVSDAALADTALSHAAVSVGTSLTSVYASALSNRKYALAMNNGSAPMYLGGGSVTTSNGFPLYPGQSIELRLGASVDIKVISSAASQDLRGLQLS